MPFPPGFAAAASCATMIATRAAFGVSESSASSILSILMPIFTARRTSCVSRSDSSSMLNSWLADRRSEDRHLLTLYSPRRYDESSSPAAFVCVLASSPSMSLLATLRRAGISGRLKRLNSHCHYCPLSTKMKQPHRRRSTHLVTVPATLQLMSSWYRCSY